MSRAWCQVKIPQTTVLHAFKRINLTHKFNHSVSHELTQHNKDIRKQTYQKLLQMYCKQSVFDIMVSCDEKLDCCNNNSRKGGWSEYFKPVGNVARKWLNKKAGFAMCLVGLSSTHLQRVADIRSDHGEWHVLWYS